MLLSSSTASQKQARLMKYKQSALKCIWRSFMRDSKLSVGLEVENYQEGRSKELLLLEL